MLAYPGDPSGAMTVIDPRTGYVKAMVGGKDADYWDATSGDGRVNLATGGSTGRQAGSSFKPFALVAALENGISPSTVFPAPSSIEIPLDNGTVWDVSNAEPSSYGSLTLEQATISSVNTVYAQLINLLGAQTVVDVAKRMGIRCCQRVSEPKRPLLPYLSAVLGTNEVNTLEMTSAYGTLAAGGQHVNPVPVISIAAADGAPVWQASPKPGRSSSPPWPRPRTTSCRRSCSTGRGPRRTSAGRRSARRARTRTTRTPGSWEPSRSWSPRSGWGSRRGRSRCTAASHASRSSAGRGLPRSGVCSWRRPRSTFPVREFPTPDVNYVAVAVDVTQNPYCLPNQYTLPQNIQTLEFIAGTEPTQTCTEPTSLQEIPVPSVVGLSQAAAMTVLADAGFYVKVVLAISTQPAGIVISQSPSAGVSAFQTSSVMITVSKDLSSPSP